MGDIADGMIDGTLDYETGEYLGEGEGYPRRAKDLSKDKNITETEIVLKRAGIVYKAVNNGVTFLIRYKGAPNVDFYATKGTWKVVGDSPHAKDGVQHGGAEKFVKWFFPYLTGDVTNTPPDFAGALKRIEGKLDFILEKLGITI